MGGRQVVWDVEGEGSGAAPVFGVAAVGFAAVGELAVVCRDHVRAVVLFAGGAEFAVGS